MIKVMSNTDFLDSLSVERPVFSISDVNIFRSVWFRRNVLLLFSCVSLILTLYVSSHVYRVYRYYGRKEYRELVGLVERVEGESKLLPDGHIVTTQPDPYDGFLW